MFHINIMQTPDFKFYWVMLSPEGDVICRSEKRYDYKSDALHTANMLRRKNRVELVDFSKVRNKVSQNNLFAGFRKLLTLEE